MAKQRTKSYQQIMEQAARLRQEVGRRAEREGWTPDLDKRDERIMEIEDRYLSNIRAQKADIRDTALYDQALSRDRDLEKAKRIAKRNGTRQWSRSTYMGLGNG